MTGGPKNTFRCKLGGAGTACTCVRESEAHTESYTQRVRASAAACAKTRREMSIAKIAAAATHHRRVGGRPAHFAARFLKLRFSM